MHHTSQVFLQVKKSSFNYVYAFELKIQEIPCEKFLS